MTDKYSETLERLTASDQVFAFHEELHDSGITYREFTNAPKTLTAFFEFGLLFPEWEFIVFNDERYTFQDIHKKAAQTANALKDVGVKKGDRVAICMANNPDYIVVISRLLKRFSSIEELRNHPSLSQTTAAQNDNIIAKDGMAMMGFGPRTIAVSYTHLTLPTKA